MYNFVPEYSQKLLELFPHRFDFIWCHHCHPGEKPEWRTETRYPLADRMILEGRKLYGVRFGGVTNYLMLDIDRKSPYHPVRDRLAINRIIAALEPLGLVSSVNISSSYSKGIHVYLPFPDAVPSWQLAAAASWFLTKAGFWIENGVLEVFPNVQNYDTSEGKFSRFNAHRLPLQAGSYLLSDNYELDYSDSNAFVSRWRWASARNEIDLKAVEWAHKKLKARRFRALSFRGNQFLEDLNTCIEGGWNSHGQTNFLLGRIALRSYVFGHVLTDSKEPLTGDKLTQEIVRTATQLPGYSDFCSHQHEIWKRAEEWGRCAESSHYYPYGRSKPPVATNKINWTAEWNRFQERRAIERIAFAVADAIHQSHWPQGITERFNVLLESGFSGETLYRHADLWHPEVVGAFSTDNDGGAARLAKGRTLERSKGASSVQTQQSLLNSQGVNPSNAADHRPFWEVFREDIGCNPLLDKRSSDSDPEKGADDG